MTSRILIFGGTTEGRQLAEALGKCNNQVFLSVATHHGTAMVESLTGVDILEGRLSQLEMEKVLVEHKITHVVDATHPFALEVSASIGKAAQKKSLPLYRLVREVSSMDYGQVYSSEEELVSALNKIDGNILLTTGSKTLEKFTAVKDFENRVYPRILPMVSSTEKALSLGYHPSKIIALQGPFSKDFNCSMIKEFKISAMVTKDSGESGGYSEKAESAKEQGIELLILRRPEEEGYTLDQLIKLLTQEGKI